MDSFHSLLFNYKMDEQNLVIKGIEWALMVNKLRII